MRSFFGLSSLFVALAYNYERPPGSRAHLQLSGDRHVCRAASNSTRLFHPARPRVSLPVCISCLKLDFVTLF